MVYEYISRELGEPDVRPYQKVALRDHGEDGPVALGLHSPWRFVLTLIQSLGRV